MNAVEQALIWALKTVETRFEDDELAYLALTSKIELPFRDRLAFELHQKLAKKGYIVSREWPAGHRRGRVDIAILRGVEPVALIELKAMYIFDAVLGTGLETFYKAVVIDEKKMRSVMKNPAKEYTLFLATLPEKEGGGGLKGVIKYQDDIRKSLKRFGGNITDLTVAAIAKIEKRFAGRRTVKRGTVDGGASFGIKASVRYWLFQVKG